MKTYRFSDNSQLLIYKNTISLFLVGQNGNDPLCGGDAANEQLSKNDGFHYRGFKGEWSQKGAN
ncbi:MAG TPA: hypothetical protein VGE97_03135 [Nitrososphaera sp.]